jgi:hypothetical protein
MSLNDRNVKQTRKIERYIYLEGKKKEKRNNNNNNRQIQLQKETDNPYPTKWNQFAHV